MGVYKKAKGHILSMGEDPNERLLRMLVTNLKTLDWTDRGDITNKGVTAFRKWWTAQLADWSLTSGKLKTLSDGLADDRNIDLQSMSDAVRDLVPTKGEESKTENEMKQENETAERVAKMEENLRAVGTRYNTASPLAKLGDIWNLDIAGELKNEATRTQTAKNIARQMAEVVLRMIPEVIINRSSTTTFIIIILALASAGATLQEPGDTVHAGGITAGLHMDEKGETMISLKWRREAVEVAHHTEITDFGDFSDMEERLENLTRSIRGETVGNWSQRRPAGKMTKRHCDCILTDNYPGDNSTKAWVMPHQETHLPMCRSNDKPEGNKYEVTVRATEQGPECTISPTNATRQTIERAFKTPSNELVSELNQDRRHPCIAMGGYNLNRIPRESITKKETGTLIECILHCTFSQTCTTWMFHEQTGVCWLLSIKRKYQFGETREAGAKIYTGERACTPCGLEARIEIPDNSKDIWEDRCVLTLDNKIENPLRCPCDAKATYKNNIKELEASTSKSRRNNIRRTVKNFVTRDLTEGLKLALEGSTKTMVGAALESIMSKPADMDTRDPVRVIMKLDPSGTLTRLFTKALKLTARVAQDSLVNKRAWKRSITNRITYEGNAEIAKLLAGRLQTNGAIRKALTLLDDDLEAAATRKHMEMQGARVTKQQDHDHNEKAIRVTADWGDKITRTSLVPKKLGTSRDTITVCPIPTRLDKNRQEGPTLEGEVSSLPGKNNHWKLDCANQMEAAQPYLEDCNPGGNPRALRQIVDMDIDDIEGKMTLVRITRVSQKTTTFIIECNGNHGTMTVAGVMVALVGPGCEISTSEGRTVKRKRTNKGASADYWVIYNSDLEWSFTHAQTTDNWHSTLIALIILAIGSWIARKCSQKIPCKKAVETTTNPQRGSPRGSGTIQQQ